MLFGRLGIKRGDAVAERRAQAQHSNNGRARPQAGRIKTDEQGHARHPRCQAQVARLDSAWRVQAALMAAAQIGAVALRTDSNEAESARAAMANSRNGSAELNKPSTR